MKIEHTSFSWYMKRFIFLSLNTIYKILLAICTGWYDSVWQNKLYSTAFWIGTCILVYTAVNDYIGIVHMPMPVLSPIFILRHQLRHYDIINQSYFKLRLEIKCCELCYQIVMLEILWSWTQLNYESFISSMYIWSE